jgi:hypothetical protein
MSTDLLPFSAYGLEAAPPAAAPGEGHTLTLQLRVRHSSLAGAEPMTGTMAIRVAAPEPANTLRAEAVASDATPLTITF